MKKLLLTLLLLASAGSFTMANPTGGFQDTNRASVSTIQQALKMPDNSFVTIKGNIIKRLSNDEYMFKDSTGSMTIEIDEDKWQGQVINSKDVIEISGEIEKKYNSTKLDVDSITKVNK